MKEIGEKLQEARESIGVSIEEAAEDLKVTPEQIQNIESGNMEAFQDIFYLKYFIRDYSKYLGLDKEDMVDEFNEYLFDYTSKISLEDIKRAKKGEIELEKKVRSPYTIVPKKKRMVSPVIFYGVIIVVIVIIAGVIYFLAQNAEKTPEEDLIARSCINCTVE